MNFIRTSRRWWVSGALALAAWGAVGAAQARDVYWSVGVGAPGAAVVVGNAPVYVAPPVVVQAPRYYQPAPAYYAPEPVYYAPRPVYYGPQPVYRMQAPPRWVERGHRHGGPRHDHYHHRGHRDGR